ncbi:DUF4811 domain-containing protein [Loigolactobacillus zhaoyuanensis]|uniref:DUF4811 domain-containing protein n=1 Tax=Loigolactobacillus zhaoyuanensis TaxID=2486017 RepID=A0ABW8UD59_9LACO|nr:DUF4811 domain-containing protein [Loigolactobacillus zhaoyuanensis]
MLIVLVLLSALLFAIITISTNNSSATRNGIAGLMLVLLVGSIALLFVNDDQHWGMKTVTTTTEKPLTSATDMSGANLLLYQALGNGKEKIFIYKTSAQQKKVTTTPADIKTTSSVTKSSAKNAKLVTKTTRYVYRNGFYRALFAGTGNNHTFKSRHNEFKVGSNWVVLSTQQAKQLQKQAKVTAAKTKTELAAAVKAKMTAALQQNPQMTTEQQQALQKQYTTAAQAQAQQQLLAQLQKESLK